MLEILIRAACFVAIILIGYSLKKIGFFKQEDFHLLSKIVLRITLPAAIISNFAGAQLDPAMLIFTVFGLGAGILIMFAGYLIALKKGNEAQAFHVLNIAGYNIGNFTMPFVQSFLGPVGVITTSLFDTGNSFVCLGGAFSIASMIQKKDGRFSIFPILKALAKSIPFMTYLVMTILCFFHIGLPTPVQTLAGIISNSNAFLAMLMIGVGFRLSGERSQIGTIVKILLVRYGIGISLAFVFYFLLPFSLESRQALAILALGPIASAAPAFTAEMKGDFGLASAINSMSILISIVLITSALVILL